MKKLIYAITTKSQWLLNFTSSLAGTILGIVLTFGIGTYIQNLNQVERSNKILDFALTNIEENLTHLNDALKLQLREDTLLRAVHKSYNNRELEIDGDTLMSYLHMLVDLSYDEFDHSAEPMFSSSIDIWPTEENEELITIIRDCFTLMREVQKELEECNKIKDTFYSKFIYNFDKANLTSKEEFLEMLFNTEGYLYYATRYNYYCEMLEIHQEDLSFYLECAYEELEILGGL